MSLHLEAVLRRVAELAQRREPLAEGLRASGLPGAAALADDLDAGRDLAAALRERLGERLALLLTGPRPPLEQSALAVAEELRLARERRAILVEACSYPVLTLVAMCAVAAWLRWGMELEIAASWLWAAPPILLLCAIPMGIPFVPARTAAALPTLCGWRAHARRAERYERAALAARWRLEEAQMERLFGDPLADLAPVLGEPDAEEHCRRLAEHHRDAARRGVRRAALWLTIGLDVCAGVIALAVFLGLLGDLTGAIAAELG